MAPRKGDVRDGCSDGGSAWQGKGKFFPSSGPLGWAAAKAEVDDNSKDDPTRSNRTAPFRLFFRRTGDPSLPAAYVLECVAYNPLPFSLVECSTCGRGWHSYTENGNNHRGQI